MLQEDPSIFIWSADGFPELNKHLLKRCNNDNRKMI